MRSKYIKYWSPILAFIMMIVMTSCDEKNAEVTEYNIIPEPAYMVQKARSFSFSSRTKLYFENLAQNSSTTKFITNTLRKMHIRPAFIGTPNRGSITITLNDTINPSLGEEGYLLQVLPDGIFISANTEAGLIYAFETPEKMTVPANKEFTVKTSAYAADIAYCWQQYDAAGKKWVDVANGNAAECKLSAAEAAAGTTLKYRCKISYTGTKNPVKDALYTNEVTVTVAAK